MNYPHEQVKMQSHHDPCEDPSYYSGAAGGTMMNMDECSSGFQSASVSNFPSELPSSSSTTINEYAPQPPPPALQQPLMPPLHLPPPPPPPPPPQLLASPSTALPAPIPYHAPSKVIEELSKFICNESDKVVSTNALGILFSYSINSFHGPEVCQLMSESPVILNALYNLLTSEQFEDDDPIRFLATGNLTNISKYESGRDAILGCNGMQANEWPSRGILSLMNSLQSRDSNVIIFAITAVHNLLLDRRAKFQETAKNQIKSAQGIGHIVRQLANQSLVNHYEFKVIVLDCLQILAYGNMENRLTILESGGPQLLLRTIQENFDNQPTEELVETASRVLKSLSACPHNKLDIIKNDGISILTRCIKRDNQEILKTCLWTLRNLSDVIIHNGREQSACLNQLIQRLLGILYEYSEEPCIVACALGTLANLTCNNEPMKQLICDYNGIELILGTIDVALRDSLNFKIDFREILEPAICALCHLMNQTNYPNLDRERLRVKERFLNDPVFRNLKWAQISEDLSKAIDKLIRLLDQNLTPSMNLN